MRDKIILALLLLLIAAVAYLMVQNHQLNSRIDELSDKVAVNIAPVHQSTPYPTPPPSPFDKPHTDPLSSQFPQESDNMPEPTKVKWEKTFHDFGRLNEGEVVKTVFRFTNTGEKPLIISNAQGSCGCTVPRWPQHPIQPGAMDEIAVEFNSAGKRGENDKTVTVTANTQPANTTLTIRSTVIPKDN